MQSFSFYKPYLHVFFEIGFSFLNYALEVLFSNLLQYQIQIVFVAYFLLYECSQFTLSAKNRVTISPRQLGHLCLYLMS